MQMDEGLDTGAMLLREICPIAAGETAQSLHAKLAVIGADSILEVLRQLPIGLAAVAQDNDAACYAAKLLKSEAQINWRLDASAIERTIRAFNPFPLCNFNYDRLNIKVWQASLQEGLGLPGQVLAVDRLGVTVACGSGAVRLEILQKPGGKAQFTAQFLQAVPIKVGTVLPVN